MLQIVSFVPHPQANEKSKYDAIFESLQPVSGKLGGDKVKPVRSPVNSSSFSVFSSLD